MIQKFQFGKETNNSYQIKFSMLAIGILKEQKLSV